MELHEKLQTLMRESNMTQADLARKLETNRSNVCSWYYGRTKPKSESVSKIALIFDVSEAWLNGVEGVTRERREHISPELKELIRLYNLLDVRDKTRLLTFAYELEEAEKVIKNNNK